MGIKRLVVLLCLLGTALVSYGGPKDMIQQFAKDSSTQSILSLPYEHHEIHEGRHWFIAQASDTTEQTQGFLFEVHEKCPHITFVTEVESQSTISVYQAVSVSASGTPIYTPNSNCNSTRVPITVVYSQPSISSTGVLLWQQIVGSGHSGGFTTRDEEMDWKLHTLYYVVVERGGVGTYWSNYRFSWYENGCVRE